jgi:hypothetical protein
VSLHGNRYRELGLGIGLGIGHYTKTYSAIPHYTPTPQIQLGGLGSAVSSSSGSPPNAFGACREQMNGSRGTISFITLN